MSTLKLPRPLEPAVRQEPDAGRQKALRRIDQLTAFSARASWSA
jgi:hypothetical protein